MREVTAQMMYVRLRQAVIFQHLIEQLISVRVDIPPRQSVHKIQECCQVALSNRPDKSSQIRHLIECANELHNVRVAKSSQNFHLFRLHSHNRSLLNALQRKIDTSAFDLNDFTVETISKDLTLLERKRLILCKFSVETSTRPIFFQRAQLGQLSLRSPLRSILHGRIPFLRTSKAPGEEIRRNVVARWIAASFGEHGTVPRTVDWGKLMMNSGRNDAPPKSLGEIEMPPKAAFCMRRTCRL